MDHLLRTNEPQAQSFLNFSFFSNSSRASECGCSFLCIFKKIMLGSLNECGTLFYDQPMLGKLCWTLVQNSVLSILSSLLCAIFHPSILLSVTNPDSELLLWLYRSRQFIAFSTNSFLVDFDFGDPLSVAFLFGLSKTPDFSILSMYDGEMNNTSLVLLNQFQFQWRREDSWRDHRLPFTISWRIQRRCTSSYQDPLWQMSMRKDSSYETSKPCFYSFFINKVVVNLSTF